MEKENTQKSQDVPSGIKNYFLARGYDYVEFLGNFIMYKVYRARYFNDNAIAPCPTILAKERRFRKCRPGYETHVVYEYLEKEQNNYFKWYLIVIRIRLLIDKILCYILVLLIPHSDYGLLKKIKKISSEVWKTY